MGWISWPRTLFSVWKSWMCGRPLESSSPTSRGACGRVADDVRGHREDEREDTTRVLASVELAGTQLEPRGEGGEPFVQILRRAVSGCHPCTLAAQCAVEASRSVRGLKSRLTCDETKSAYRWCSCTSQPV